MAGPVGMVAHTARSENVIESVRNSPKNRTSVKKNYLCSPMMKESPDKRKKPSSGFHNTPLNHYSRQKKDISLHQSGSY